MQDLLLVSSSPGTPLSCPPSSQESCFVEPRGNPCRSPSLASTDQVPWTKATVGESFCGRKSGLWAWKLSPKCCALWHCPDLARTTAWQCVRRAVARALCCFLGLKLLLCKAFRAIPALGVVRNFHSTAVAVTLF